MRFHLLSIYVAANMKSEIACFIAFSRGEDGSDAYYLGVTVFLALFISIIVIRYKRLCDRNGQGNSDVHNNVHYCLGS